MLFGAAAPRIKQAFLTRQSSTYNLDHSQSYRTLPLSYFKDPEIYPRSYYFTIIVMSNRRLSVCSTHSCGVDWNDKKQWWHVPVNKQSTHRETRIRSLSIFEALSSISGYPSVDKRIADSSFHSVLGAILFFAMSNFHTTKKHRTAAFE